MIKDILDIVLASMILAAVYMLLLLIPFEWFVDVEKVTWSDMCVGDQIQRGVTSERTALFDISGSAYGEAIYLENGQRIETTIKRGSLEEQIIFTYEADIDSATYDVLWNSPFQTPGTYGVQDTITIYPLPFLPIKKIFLAEDNTFNVEVCNPANV